MKTPLAILCFVLLYCSCVGKHDTKASAAQVLKKEAPSLTSGDTLNIAPLNANIKWNGTKMKGSGKHEGKIRLKKGFLLTENKQLTGGSFTIDMNSITVTDIPAHEPVAKRNLINHLKSDDFFSTATYPEANFTITNVIQKEANTVIIEGNLTIKNTTKAIAITGQYHNNILETTFTFDRTLWDIAYTGSWVKNTFVDKDVLLEISISAQP